METFPDHDMATADMPERYPISLANVTSSGVVRPPAKDFFEQGVTSDVACRSCE
jgi:hypothetical protein